MIALHYEYGVYCLSRGFLITSTTTSLYYFNTGEFESCIHLTYDLTVGLFLGQYLWASKLSPNHGLSILITQISGAPN